MEFEKTESDQHQNPSNAKRPREDVDEKDGNPTGSSQEIGKQLRLGDVDENADGNPTALTESDDEVVCKDFWVPDNPRSVRKKVTVTVLGGQSRPTYSPTRTDYEEDAASIFDSGYPNYQPSPPSPTFILDREKWASKYFAVRPGPEEICDICGGNHCSTRCYWQIEIPPGENVVGPHYLIACGGCGWELEEGLHPCPRFCSTQRRRAINKPSLCHFGTPWKRAKEPVAPAEHKAILPKD